VGVFAMAWLVGCATDSNGRSTMDEAGVGRDAATGGNGGSTSGEGGRAGSSGGTRSGGSSGSGPTIRVDGGDGSPDGAGVVPLPAGSREVGGIVNLVDAAAAAELESVIAVPTKQFLTLRHGFNKSLNLFLEDYQEDYDFVFFFTDHAVAMAPVAGLFEPVTRPAGPGGVSEFEIAAEGYETTGRVKGVVAFPYNAGIYPPLAHEMAHYWAVDLDDRFGFGVGLDASSSYPSHWGFASVNGQLGGFDGTTLRCETPAGAMPPACTGQSGGRIRYVTGPFAPNTNTFRGVPYAPIELYLMGLAPGTEVPASIQTLTAAKSVTVTNTAVTIEASGVKTIAFSDIVARHGTPKLLAANARHFDTAFVVLSAAPAADAVMNEIADFAAAFGKRKVITGWQSFEEHTRGRATMSTALGPRRSVGSTLPPARKPLKCDPVAQDCPRSELGCYMEPPAVCALSGKVALDQPCDAVFACTPGTDCVASAANPTKFVCQPYCDPNDATAVKACAKLCRSNQLTFKDTSGAIVGAICLPP
jgi:hypothetical protein